MEQSKKERREEGRREKTFFLILTNTIKKLKQGNV